VESAFWEVSVPVSVSVEDRPILPLVDNDCTSSGPIYSDLEPIALRTGTGTGTGTDTDTDTDTDNFLWSPLLSVLALTLVTSYGAGEQNSRHSPPSTDN
jgi:hypothetical protein